MEGIIICLLILFAAILFFVFAIRAGQKPAMTDTPDNWKVALEAFAGPHILDIVSKAGGIPAGNFENVFSATIAFIDSKGFQSPAMCSQNTLVECRHEIICAVFEAVENNGGFIHQLMGDCAIACFNGKNHANDALKCFLDVKKELIEINKKFAPAGMPATELATGMDTGDVATIISGSRKRKVVSLLGTPVFTASRLHQLSGQSCHNIILSERMRNALQESSKNEVVEIDKILERGVAEPVGVFTLKDQ